MMFVSPKRPISARAINGPDLDRWATRYYSFLSTAIAPTRSSASLHTVENGSTPCSNCVCNPYLGWQQPSTIVAGTPQCFGQRVHRLAQINHGDE